MSKTLQRAAWELGIGSWKLQFDPRHRFLQIALVHFDADEVESQVRAGDRRRSEAEKWIRDRPDAIDAVQPEAHVGEPRRNRRRMRALLIAALNGVVRDEPGVAAAAEVIGSGAPPPDVRFVLISHTNRLAAEWCLSLRGEVEHELVAVVQEALAVDWLVVADGEVVFEAGARARERLFDRNRLDPVNRVLQLEVWTRGLRDIERRPGVSRFAANGEEQRTVVGKRP